MASPVLSLTMPTRNRPELLERALRSLVTAMAPVAEHVEVTVSDGSEANTSGRVVDRLLKDWPGGHRYVWNRPALTLVENMNRAAELATGEWVQQLDDDDLMLPSCGQPMIDCLRRVAPRSRSCSSGLTSWTPVASSGASRSSGASNTSRRGRRSDGYYATPPSCENRWWLYAGLHSSRRACSSSRWVTRPIPTCG